MDPEGTINKFGLNTIIEFVARGEIEKAAPDVFSAEEKKMARKFAKQGHMTTWSQ